MANDKMQKEIFAVKREDLFLEGSFQGYVPCKLVDYHSRIIKSGSYFKRGDIENDPRIKHPIPYGVIFNPEIKKIFVYQRAKLHDEERLGGKLSIGVGGHVEKSEVIDEEDPILATMLIELNEEVKINGMIRPKLSGYINDDSNNVGKVHLGLLYLIETDTTNVCPIHEEISQGSMKSLDEIQELLKNPDFEVENWSKIALIPITEFLETLAKDR
jgi:predicted NUDIX family phosphoesterase